MSFDLFLRHVFKKIQNLLEIINLLNFIENENFQYISIQEHVWTRKGPTCEASLETRSR
jgi:hypothetical protein